MQQLKAFDPEQIFRYCHLHIHERWEKERLEAAKYWDRTNMMCSAYVLTT